MGEEEQKQEEKPVAPLVIHVDLHCAGCSKKIQRYTRSIKGVEGVVVDKDKNQLTIKGEVDHKAVCKIITEKMKRKVTVISPVPEAVVEPIPEAVKPQVDVAKTVELKVNMHCEACAQQLKQKILKLRGVKTATTEFSTGKVVVTGTMDAGKLVDYVYRRTKKQALIVPAPEPEPVAEKKETEAPPVEEKKEEPPPAEEKKEEPSPVEEKKEEPPPVEEKKEEPPVEEKKEEKEQKESKAEDEEAARGEMYLNEEENLKKMVYYYQPMYVYESMHAPQLFSDENPNACCIS